jgi:hypothetical protein
MNDYCNGVGLQYDKTSPSGSPICYFTTEINTLSGDRVYYVNGQDVSGAQCYDSSCISDMLSDIPKVDGGYYIYMTGVTWGELRGAASPPLCGEGIPYPAPAFSCSWEVNPITIEKVKNYSPKIKLTSVGGCGDPSISGGGTNWPLTATGVGTISNVTATVSCSKTGYIAGTFTTECPDLKVIYPYYPDPGLSCSWASSSVAEGALIDAPTLSWAGNSAGCTAPTTSISWPVTASILSNPLTAEYSTTCSDSEYSSKTFTTSCKKTVSPNGDCHGNIFCPGLDIVSNASGYSNWSQEGCYFTKSMTTVASFDDAIIKINGQELSSAGCWNNCGSGIQLVDGGYYIHYVPTREESYGGGEIRGSADTPYCN